MVALGLALLTAVVLAAWPRATVAAPVPGSQLGDGRSPSVLVNVEDYGAKHDGVANDQPAIAAAIAAAAAAGGGTVYLPAGTYHLELPERDPEIGPPDNPMHALIVLRDHVAIQGDGIGFTVISNTSQSYVSTFGGYGVKDFRIADLSCTTPLNGSHGGDGDAIKVFDCSRSTIANVYAENHYTDFMLYGCQDTTLFRCVAKGRKGAASGTSLNFVIDSWTPTAPNTDGVTLIGCESFDSQQCGFWAYVAYGGSDSFRVRNVAFIDCRAHDNLGAGFYSTWSEGCTWRDCASDRNGWGFYLDDVKDYLVTGCAAQGNQSVDFRYPFGAFRSW